MAHLYETGRLRRVHLRGHNNILKRLLIHACGLNLGLLLRTLYGVGTPRGLQDGRLPPLFMSASSGEFVGDSEGQRFVEARKRRNFRQVESNDLC